MQNCNKMYEIQNDSSETLFFYSVIGVKLEEYKKILKFCV